ncbi:MAG: sulfatase-like hydrolase/transferase [Lentisphaerae bacterium]|nr:sulfatase-like hydrolase/transferase [Lentisphaerota bacterium]
MADDVSANAFSCYGNVSAKTPHLESLARGGVVFKTCWSTPLCSPSRAMIMTGRYGFRTQWYHNNLHPREPLCDRHQTLGQVMRAGGYATGIVGKWQLPGTQQAYGFDEHYMWLGGHNLCKTLLPEFDGPVEKEGMTLPGRPSRYWHPAIVHDGKLVKTGADDYAPELFADFANDFISRHRAEPFLLYYPMVLPHTSWDFERNRDGYLPTPNVGPDGKRSAGRSKPTMEANVAYIDHIVGRIVGQLDRLGIRDNTVVLFTGDNATGNYGKGQVVQERGQRVPMIVNGPGLVKPIGESDELVDFSDILPTVAGLTGISLPEDYALDGHSFAPLLAGQPFTGREWIFSYLGDKRMLRDKRWLLDGAGQFYDCGDNRAEKGYKTVTQSKDPEVIAARNRFNAILAKLPAPNLKDPAVRRERQPASAPQASSGEQPGDE